MEIVPDGDGYKFLRTSAESQWLGVKADDIDGWYNSEQYRCFRSSVPSVVAHEKLSVTKPQYNTHVKIDSVLTYVEYGKYYEKFSSDPAYAQFKQFYKQPVSTVVTVIGTTGIEDPSVEDITITVNVTGSTFAPAFADLTAATYTCKSNAYQTAWDALESVLTSNSYTYTGSGNYVTGVTDPAGCRLYAGDPAHGEWSGWMYTVNGKMPMLDATTYATLDKYLLQANDRIDFYYVNCPTESGDHDWTENTAKRQEPTCTADGSAFYSCSTCGGTKTEKLPATGHQYGEPAWTWIGYESASATFTCANDASHEETVAAAVTSAVTKEPTCTEDGLRTYTASVTFGEKNYTDTKTEGIKATGEHVWDNGVVTTEPTCTAKGVKTYTCTKCSATKTEELNALGYNYETKRTEPTCEKDGKEEEVCSRCGNVRFSRVLPATGHSYRWDPRTRRTVCENCGKILDEGGNTRPIIPANPGKTDKNFPFTDVSKNDGCYDAVDYLYSKGIMNGTSSTKFSPNGELTRNGRNDPV